MASTCVLGIDFGTNNCRACVYNNDSLSMIYDDHGDRYMPCCVYYHGEEVVVGTGAVSQSKNQLTSTIFHPKHSITKRPCFNEENENKAVTISDSSIVFHISNNDENKDISIEKAISDIFISIYQFAQQSTNQSITQTVISFSNDIQLSDYHYLEEASKIAKLPNVSFIPDSISVLLSQEIDNKHTSGLYLLIDLPASTPFLSLYSINKGLIQCLYSKRGTDSIGDLIDKALYTYVINEACKKVGRGVSTNKKSITKLKYSITSCKEKLSTTMSSDIVIDSLYDGLDFHLSLNRGRFDVLIRDVINKLNTFIISSLQEASIPLNTINSCIVYGASGLIPCIQQGIKNIFVSSPTTQCILSSNCDEYVAMGAAKQAYTIQQYTNKERINQLYSFNYDIYTSLNSNISLCLSKNTPLPTSNTIDINIDKDYDVYTIQFLISKDINTYIQLYKKELKDLNNGYQIELSCYISIFDGIKIKIICYDNEDSVVFKSEELVSIDKNHMIQH